MNLASPTWETDPDVVLTAIERMRLQPDDAAPQRGLARLAADREAAAAQLAARVDDAAGQQLDTAMRAASIWLPARELSKYNHVRLQHEGRMALMEVGRRMVEDGVFDHVEDFVMIRRDEWESFVAAPGSWTEEIRHRREWARALAELDPPFITEGAPPPPSTWCRRTEPHASPVRPGEVISGIAACSGSATGIARVITDPLDGGELEPGEILVAASTDPSWTPLFVASWACPAWSRRPARAGAFRPAHASQSTARTAR
jgi:pyruvate,water dikinase